MKDVNGLGNAMQLVESACEKGEITIIGEGSTPTPVGLYKRCVDYINKQYGVDILNLVRKEQKPCGSCTTVIVDTEADEIAYVDVHLSKIPEIVKLYLGEHMSFLSGAVVDDIAKDILKAYANCVVKIEVDEYALDACEDYIYEALADNIDIDNYDEDCINKLCHLIAVCIEIDCVEK